MKKIKIADSVSGIFLKNTRFKNNLGKCGYKHERTAKISYRRGGVSVL